jgi:hypothetical protein
LLFEAAEPEAALVSFPAKGVDVVLALPDLSEVEGVEALAEAGLWVVWVLEVPARVPTDRLAGGIAFAPEALVKNALEALLSGEPGRAWPYSVEHGGVQVAQLSPEALSPGRERLLRMALEALVSGELEVGVDPVTGEPG